MSLSVGDLVGGRYRLDAIVGQGGQAQVYRATDERTGKCVAVKTLSLEGPNEEKHRARFVREVKALSLLDHPSIVRLLDMDASPAADPWVVTEYLQGRDLQALIDERGRLPELAVLHVAERVFSALREAHAVGVAHRDIKPANIFVCDNGRVVLIDFGVARGTELSRSQTMVGSAGTSVVGTPYFISPEQLRGVSVSLLSDIYTTGMTLQYALTGEIPFLGDMSAVLQAIVQGERRPLRTYPIRLVSSLADTIEACVMLDPSDRLQSAEIVLSSLAQATRHFPEREPEFLRWVTGAPAGTQTRISALPMRTVDARAVGSKNKLFGGFAATVLLLIVAFSFYRWNQREEAPESSPNSIAPLPLVGSERVPRPADPVLPPKPAAPEHVPSLGVTPEPAQARKRPLRAPSKPAILVLDMQQWGDVTIDTESKGRRQLTARFELVAGRHTLRVVNPAYGEKTWELALDADETRVLRVDLKGK